MNFEDVVLDWLSENRIARWTISAAISCAFMALLITLALLA